MSDFQQIRCPKKRCCGFVNQVDDFYGCGQCGNVWFSANDLKQDIELILQKYEHRKYCYQLDNMLLARPADDEPKNYEMLVENE